MQTQSNTQLPLPEEEWRPVVGYKGWYEVSNHGRIRRIAPNRYGKRPGILKPDISLNRYPLIRLTKLGKTTAFYIHRLVASAFIRLPHLGEEVNHKDGSRSNNSPANLEWVTPSGNQRHSLRMGLRPRGNPPHYKGERNGRAKLSPSQVREVRILRGVLTQQQIAEQFHISKTQVGTIQRFEQWRHI